MIQYFFILQALCNNIQNIVFKRRLITISLLFMRDTVIILVYFQNPPFLYQILEQIMENSILKFFGPKVWNQVNESMKSFRCFKWELKADLLFSYSLTVTKFKA